MEGGGPRSGDGTLLCPAQLPGAFDPVAANDLIEINSAVFLHDELTHDVRLLALAFVPAVVLESVLPSRLGHVSDRWGRQPLITGGLTWMGLSCLCLSRYTALGWMIVWWTLKTLGLAAALPPQKALISAL